MCTLQLVADYDQSTLQQLELVAKKVDRLYVELSYTPEQQRSYQKVASQYLDIEVSLEALKTRQQLRELNELTLKQVDITISLFRQDRELHKQRNTVSDFLLKRRRKQYNRLFISMIKGEEAKKIINNSTL